MDSVKGPSSESGDFITRDTPISDIMHKYPHAAGILLEYGLHCLGCVVSEFETLGEGASSHGMDDETIDMMIRDANSILKSVAAAESDGPTKKKTKSPSQ